MSAPESRPTTEELAAAYEAADKETKLLVRQLVKANDHRSVRLVTEILYYFPGSTAHVGHKGLPQ